MTKWLCILVTIAFYSSFSQTEYHYLVTFKNKSSNYSLSSPEDYLSTKSINRRADYQIEIDSVDLPVNTAYINSIQQHQLAIQAKSKWHNCIVVSTIYEALFDSLSAYNFVESVDLIGEIVSNKKNNDKLDYGSNEQQIELVSINFGHNLGYTGNGVEIAVIDAGFSGLSTNSFFDSLYINNQVQSTYNFITNQPISYSAHNHGTNVASVLCANVSGSYVGAAPSSKYHLLVSEDANQENKIEEFHLIEALEYCDSAGIELINISLGYSKFDDERFSHEKQELTGDSTLLAKACNIAWRNGAFIVTSAGNSGSSSWGVVTVPANSDSVFTVGAVDINEQHAYFSSKGNPAVNSTLKPNVVGVGKYVYIVKEDGTVGISNGTSFSAPQVTGLVSCLMEAFPGKKNWELKEAIEYSSHNSITPDSLIGHGIPNFENAYLYLKNDGFSKKTTYVTVYPNPSNGIFTVTNHLPIIELNLYDARGKKIMRSIPNLEIAKLNVSNLSSGMYYLQTVDENGNETIKVEVL